MNIMGYFVHRDDRFELNSTTVMVAIDEGRLDNLTYYSPMGQHSEGDRDYLCECIMITEDEYVKASNGLYTPSDYLNIGKRLPFNVWENIFRNMKEADEEVEVVWLDSNDEWCLCADCEMFEDGFKSEEEAQKRLDYLENYLQIWNIK